MSDISLEAIESSSVKELKIYLKKYNVDIKDCIEKQDLINKAKMLCEKLENEKVNSNENNDNYNNNDGNDDEEFEEREEEEEVKKKKKKLTPLKSVQQMEIKYYQEFYKTPELTYYQVYVLDHYRKYYPLIKTMEDIEKVPNFLEEVNGQFCLVINWEPQFIDEICYQGYFPMSIVFEVGPRMVAKLHHYRCILDLKDKYVLHVQKNAKKRSKLYYFSMNKAIDQVIQGVRDHHGYDWLQIPLEESFLEIHNNPDKYRANIHSFELWDKKTNKLVAGELGYFVGKNYTSLTGFFDPKFKSSGTIQLCTLGTILQNNNFNIWDFGMSMSYKLELGARDVERYEYLEMQHSSRDNENNDFKITNSINLNNDENQFNDNGYICCSRILRPHLYQT